MIAKDKCLVMDIDGTLCPVKDVTQSYENLIPYENVVLKLKEYKEEGFYIILYTSRNMKTYEGNLGKIMANTAKILFTWLSEHNIPYDEIHFGKPWAGSNGFYVDDRAIRPSEFLKLSYKEIKKLLSDE